MCYRPRRQADPNSHYLVHTKRQELRNERWIFTFLLEPAGLVSSSSPPSADAFTASLCIRLCRNSTPSPSFPLLQTLRGFTATAVPRNATLRDALTAVLLLLDTAAGDHCTAVAATAPADATAAIANAEIDEVRALNCAVKLRALSLSLCRRFWSPKELSNCPISRTRR